MAARTNEAHELRMQNHQLYEENARLNDLARMLLSSPHFANFLNEMPDNTVSPQIQAAPPQQQSQAQPQPQPQPQPQETTPQPNMQAMPKDTNHGQEFQMQQNPQVSMVMVPNPSMDAPMMNNGAWNSGIDMNYGNTPVFAVLDVPEGPVLDIEALSGKSSSPLSSKDESPVLDRPEFGASAQQSDIGVANPNVEIDETDPAFALFVDSPAPSSAPVDVASFDGVGIEKAAPHFELVVDQSSSQSTAAAQNRFNYLCASMEAAFQRVSLVTSHLI